MLLNHIEIFILGSFAFSFLLFMTHYFKNKHEKYSLHFSLTCLVLAVRIISINSDKLINVQRDFIVIKYLDCLTFIWAAYLCARLAVSLFPKHRIKIVDKALFYVCIFISILVVFVFVPFYSDQMVYDIIIISCVIYANYIYIYALKGKEQFAYPMFIANLITIFGIIYDTLYGSFVFHSPIGEISSYTFFIYLYISCSVIASKHKLFVQQHMQSEINFLHAQIKPHFLFNTISTIRACCKDNPEKARELLFLLSTYLRGKLKDSNKVLIPITEEIQLIKAYLDLEKERFKNRISVKYDIDKDCNILIPCLLIQPIVENTVKHGVLSKSDNGKIKLSIKNYGENVQITVSDNGAGMDKNKLDSIIQGEETGIGIANTNARLMHHYRIKMDIESTKDIGTTFKISIPKTKGAKFETNIK